MGSQTLQGMRVLVVEDEYYMADDLVRALESAGARPVGPFGSVRQALDAVERNGIDAAVLDLNLHGTRSDDLARQLAEAKIPILIVSGYNEGALPAELRHLQRLEKPVDSRTIISTLAAQVSVP
jgi:DNA-binding response OmpR family regulator